MKDTYAGYISPDEKLKGFLDLCQGVVILTRDPVEVLESMLEVGVPSVDEGISAWMSFLRICRDIKRHHKGGDGKTGLVVDTQELTDSPCQTFQALCEELGLAYSQTMVHGPWTRAAGDNFTSIHKENEAHRKARLSRHFSCRAREKSAFYSWDSETKAQLHRTVYPLYEDLLKYHAPLKRIVANQNAPECHAGMEHYGAQDLTSSSLPGHGP